MEQGSAKKAGCRDKREQVRRNVKASGEISSPSLIGFTQFRVHSYHLININDMAINKTKSKDEKNIKNLRKSGLEPKILQPTHFQ